MRHIIDVMRMAGAAALAALLAVGQASAQAPAHTFRWAPQTGVSTLDPHASGDTITRGIMQNIYEGLVRQDRDLKVEPELALTWSQVSPTLWRFKLRPNVVFHDGSPFSADDVVFSFRRASSGTSDIRARLRMVKEMRRVDAHTLEVETHKPAPIMVKELLIFPILSRVWAERNDSVDPADNRRSGKENFATRNANGTGPFKVTGYETDVKIEMAANERWWDKREHNLARVVLTPIRATPTRVAALLSGQVDVIMPVPEQDEPRIRAAAGYQIMEGPEGRVVYFGLDQARNELLYSSVKGRNPFKDVRVRKAFAHAIDAGLIKDKVMRGASTPVFALIPTMTDGWDATFTQRPAPDSALARRLLAEAGYPNGFTITLDCPNEGYMNVEQICVAVAGMLARIGVKVGVLSQARTAYAGKIGRRDTSFYIHSWGTQTFDAHSTIDLLLFTPGQGVGTWNIGSYSNSEVDRLITAISSEMNPGKRREMMIQAQKIAREEVGVIPLHQQMLSYGVSRKVDMVQRADDALQLRWVRMK